MCAFLKISLSRSNLSSPAKNEDGRPSTLNLRKKIQGQIIVCKTLLHSVKDIPLTVEKIFLLIKIKYKNRNAPITKYSAKITLHKSLT